MSSTTYENQYDFMETKAAQNHSATKENWGNDTMTNALAYIALDEIPQPNATEIQTGLRLMLQYSMRATASIQPEISPWQPNTSMYSYSKCPQVNG